MFVKIDASVVRYLARTRELRMSIREIHVLSRCAERNNVYDRRIREYEVSPADYFSLRVMELFYIDRQAYLEWQDRQSRTPTNPFWQDERDMVYVTRNSKLKYLGNNP